MADSTPVTTRRSAGRGLAARVVLRVLGGWGARIGLVWVGLIALLAVLAPVIASSFPYLMKRDGHWSSPWLAHLGPVDVVLLVGAFAAAGLWAIPWRGLTQGTRWAALVWSLAAVIPLASWKVIAKGWPDAGQRLYFTLAVIGAVIGGALVGGALVGPALKVRGHGKLKLVLGVAAVGLAVVLVRWPINPPAAVVYSRYREGLARGTIAHAWLAPLPYSPQDRLGDTTLSEKLLAPGWQPRPGAIRRAVRDAANNELPPPPRVSKGAPPARRAKARARLKKREAAIDALVDDAFAKARRLSQSGDKTPQQLAPPVPSLDTHTASATMVELASVRPYTRFHPMGTTAFGEDMASRMIHACRIALAIGFIATGIAVALGITIGGLMGYFSGWVDLLGMRLVEVFSSIPVIYLLIAIVAFWGRNLYLIMVIIGLTGWVGYALFIRAEFLSLRQQDYVAAARAGGSPLWSILFKHMLPNGITPVIVTASFGIADAIMTEATLSFLGLGLVEKPSWGQLLQQARSLGGSFYWWIALYPGLAIFLTVLAYNLIGESLRDALDPRAR